MREDTTAPIEVASIQKNSRESLRVDLQTFKGHRLVALRVWTADSASGEHVPTKKGINIKVEMLDQVIDALVAARSKASEIRWLERGR